MAPTIRDVAEKSNVSTATVSRALRGLPSVTPSTREKVLRTAEELGYSIEPAASRYRSGKTMNIGIVLPLSDAWFYSKLSTAAETILSDSNYYPVRYSMSSLSGQTKFFKWCSLAKPLDGLIISTVTLSNEDISFLKTLNIPIVTIEITSEHFSSVGIDNTHAATIAARYLLNLGHRNIGIISGLEDDPMRFSVPRSRLIGYHAALRQYKVKIRPELNVSGNFSLEGGAEAMVKLLSVHTPPTAIFAFSDEMAIGAMKTIREMNLRIPEDISVLGFDNHDMAEYVGLTTVHQPIAEYGEKAAEIILDRLKNNSKGEQEISHISLQTKLIVRSTTGPPPRRSIEEK